MNFVLFTMFVSSPRSAGLPVNNDDTDSNKSGSSRSDPHHHGGYHSSLHYQHPSHHHHTHVLGPGGKGKQLPKGIYLSTMELLELANDEDSASVRRLDRWVRGCYLGGWMIFGGQSSKLC